MATTVTRRAVQVVDSPTPGDRSGHLRLVHGGGNGRCKGSLVASRRRLYSPVLRAVAPPEGEPGVRSAAARHPAGTRRDRLEAAQEATGLRITRRGRLCLTLAGFAVLAGVAASILAPAVAGLAGLLEPAPATVPVSAEVERVTVLPGQTLWEIARQQRPGDDPRDVVVDIRHLNNLTDSRVMAGQQLVLPAG